jgi:hypothetical protein
MEAAALEVHLTPPHAGSMQRVTVAALHSSLLVLTPEGKVADAEQTIQVGDEIVSVDDVAAWQLGAHGVQALVKEAGSDWLRLTLSRGGGGGGGGGRDSETYQDTVVLSLLLKMDADRHFDPPSEPMWDWAYSGERLGGKYTDAHICMHACMHAYICRERHTQGEEHRISHTL